MSAFEVLRGSPALFRLRRRFTGRGLVRRSLGSGVRRAGLRLAVLRIRRARWMRTCRASVSLRMRRVVVLAGSGFRPRLRRVAAARWTRNVIASVALRVGRVVRLIRPRIVLRCVRRPRNRVIAGVWRGARVRRVTRVCWALVSLRPRYRAVEVVWSRGCSRGARRTRH